MKAIGYIRVSTDKQVANGVSLDLQDAKLVEYARFMEYDLVEIVHDDGISGKNIKDRPGMKRALKMLAGGQAQHFIIYKLDRAFRNAREALDVADILQKQGVGFHSVTERFDTTSPSGKLFFTILAAMAEWERNIISERTRENMALKKANGEKVSSQAPYGYRYEYGIAVPDEQEQACLDLLRSLRRDNPKHSLRKLARSLEGMGCVNRNGRMFDPGCIKVMLGEAQ